MDIKRSREILVIWSMDDREKRYGLINVPCISFWKTQSTLRVNAVKSTGGSNAAGGTETHAVQDPNSKNMFTSLLLQVL